MQQKLSLSCALIHEPAVLLLDEPTFGVDPISRRDLWLILHETVGRGVTVVVSTAYLDEAERCDRVVLLDQGRAAAIDRPEVLQQRLAGQVLSVRTDQPRAAMAVLGAHPAVRRAALFGAAIHVTLVAGARWEAVLPALAAAGATVLETAAIEPSLEDVFLDLLDREPPAHG
jgi:ABC-2 type transport system ATP-binding protein